MNKRIILAIFCILVVLACNSSTNRTFDTNIAVTANHNSEDMAKELPVLMYHHLLRKKENLTNNGVVLNLENFKEQMDYLHENKFTTINLAELEQWVLGNIELPKKSVCITFDDGYLSSYIYAYPILKKYNFKAAVFLITSYNKNDSMKFSSQTQQFLSREDISKTADVFEYSNHTHNMHKLENRKGYLITKPIDLVKKDLMKNIELTGSHYFSYPYGHYNDEVLALLPNIGIRLAVTVKNGTVKKGDSLLELKRYGIYPKTTLAIFKNMVNGE